MNEKQIANQFNKKYFNLFTVTAVPTFIGRVEADFAFFTNKMQNEYQNKNKSG